MYPIVKCKTDLEYCSTFSLSIRSVSAKYIQGIMWSKHISNIQVYIHTRVRCTQFPRSLKSWLTFYISPALIQWLSWNICGSNIFLFRAILVSNLEQFMVHELIILHDDVIKWKHFPRNLPFVRGIHRSRWIPHTKASDAELSWMLSLICIWIKGCIYNPEAGDLRRHRGHYDVNVMVGVVLSFPWNCGWRNRNGKFYW